jgi:hypothetical protein
VLGVADLDERETAEMGPVLRQTAAAVQALTEARLGLRLPGVRP